MESAVNAGTEEAPMARDPDELDVEMTDTDVEAIVDEEPPGQPLVDAAGLGADLPEADVLDQWREVELDDEER